MQYNIAELIMVSKFNYNSWLWRMSVEARNKIINMAKKTYFDAMMEKELPF